MINVSVINVSVINGIFLIYVCFLRNFGENYFVLVGLVFFRKKFNIWKIIFGIVLGVVGFILFFFLFIFCCWW